jgi:hypothetical protein
VVLAGRTLLKQGFSALIEQKHRKCAVKQSALVRLELLHPPHRLVSRVDEDNCFHSGL